MTLDQRKLYVEQLRSALSVVVLPIQYLVNTPVGVANWMGDSLASRGALLSENESLTQRNLLLRAQLAKYEALEAENMRLRELLESSLKVGERVLVADLIAVELDSASRQVMLNKGSRDGVYIGQPIVDADGIMGQVVHVGPFTSTGMLITDLSHALPVQVNRSGVRAIAMGTGVSDTLELAYVPTNADVKQGDLIVSSGVGGRFPAGYPVGAIDLVEFDPGEPFARITARPSAQLMRSREVLLVWPEMKQFETGPGLSKTSFLP